MPFTDPSFERPPNPRGERMFYGILLLAMLGLFACELIFNYEPRKISALFFLTSWILLLVIHEFGHALMAWICGWGVKCIVIGVGRTIRTFHFRGVPIEFRLFPVSGYVVPIPKDHRSVHLKNGLIYAAGPGIELWLAGCIFMMLGSQTVFSLSNHWAHLFAQSFAAAAVVGAVMNLIPFPIRSGNDGEWTPSDGLGILLAIQGRTS